MGTMYEEERRKYHRKNERLGRSQEGEAKESQQNEMMVCELIHENRRERYARNSNSK
jgi:hypothetical protein